MDDTRDMPITAILSPAEWRLIAAVREIPLGSPLRMKVSELLDELVRFVEDPKCPEMQGDGVPCEEVHGECAQCGHVGDMLDGMALLDHLPRKPGAAH